MKYRSAQIRSSQRKRAPKKNL